MHQCNVLAHLTAARAALQDTLTPFKRCNSYRETQVQFLFLSHAPQKAAQNEHSMNDSSICVQDYIPGGKKITFSSVPIVQRFLQLIAEPQASRSPPSPACKLHFLPERTPLMNKDCKLFVPFSRSFLPWQQVAITFNPRKFLPSSLFSVSPLHKPNYPVL